MPVYPEHLYWDAIEEGQLAVRFSWSEYLPYFLDNQTLAYEWQQYLVSQVAAAVDENLLPAERVVDHGVEIVQVGSAAQECHEVLLWLKDLPREIATGLVVLGIEYSLAKFLGYVKHRVQKVRRVYGGQDVGVDFEVHSRTLVELCREHVTRTHGEAVIHERLWTLESQVSANGHKDEDLAIGVFQIVLRTPSSEHSYLVHRKGEVLEYRVDGKGATSPLLIPEVQDTSDEAPVRILASRNEWPSQDGVDRSGHIAVHAGCRSDPNLAGTFLQPYLQHVVRESVAEVLPNLDATSFVAQDHEIGPAAGAVDDWVVTLFENREAFQQAIGLIVDTRALYEIVSRVRRRLQRDKATKQNDGVPVRFYLPGGTLAMLCEEHVRRNYHPRAHLNSEWYCITREFWFGYTSPGHPNGSIEYLVLVSTSQETYRYRVWGTGKVTAHSLRRGRLDAELPVPDLFEEGNRNAAMLLASRVGSMDPQGPDHLDAESDHKAPEHDR